MRILCILLCLTVRCFAPVIVARGPVQHTAPAGNISFVVGAEGFGANSATTAGVTTTGADFLVLVVVHYGLSAAPTVADSKLNDWNALTRYGAGATTAIQIWWSKPTTVGTSHTVTATGTSSFSAIFLAAFSGLNATPYDQTSGASEPSPPKPGSLTPSVANSLFITGLGSAAAATYSVDSGFTITDQMPLSGGVNFGGGLAYLIQSGGPTAANPEWTNGGANTAITLAVFKP